MNLPNDMADVTLDRTAASPGRDRIRAVNQFGRERHCPGASHYSSMLDDCRHALSLVIVRLDDDRLTAGRLRASVGDVLGAVTAARA
jgi:hypothetical protein